MRLFLAVDLHPDVLARVEEAREKLHRLAPKSKWVAADKLHLTVLFLGEVDESKVESLGAALEAAVRPAHPLTLRVQGSGGFPHPHRPRVFWFGVTGELDLLDEVKARLEAVVPAFGVELEQRAFRPHLTLARAGHPRGDLTLARCIEESQTLDFGSTQVREVVLYKSQLSPQGARYSVVRRMPFAGA